jgi:hypothetical protein
MVLRRVYKINLLHAISKYLLSYTAHMSDAKNKHKYQKDKNGIKIEKIDPIQDIMNDEELNESEKRLKSLIGDDL